MAWKRRPAILMMFLFHLTMAVMTTHNITVSSQGKDDPSCWKSGAKVPCKTLEFAMSSPNLSDTRIILEGGIHNLSASISRSHLHTFTIQGQECDFPRNCSEVDTTLQCIQQGSGLSFQTCTNLVLSSFQIKNCGANHLSTSSLSSNGPYSNLSTALHLRKTVNVSVNQVSVTNSDGMGAVFYDVGGLVEITHTNFQNNAEHKFFYENQTKSSSRTDNKFRLSGGGLYIEFTNISLVDSYYMAYVSNSRYHFKNCTFKSNVAFHKEQNDSSTYNSFGLGGGMSILLRGNATNNSFLLEDCHFHKNKALWGAGLFVESKHNAIGNILNIINSKFVGNNATYGGGGLQICSRSRMLQGGRSTNIERCKFYENSARVGGGFSQFRTSKRGIINEAVQFKHCNIKWNVGDHGSAIRTVFTHLTLENTTVINNKPNAAKEYNSRQGQGSIYVSDGSITFRSYNILKQNSNTGIVLENSKAVVHRTINLINNRGTNGGALAMYGNSYIILKRDSTVNFLNNSATEKGGAVYINLPGPYFIPLQTTKFLMSGYGCNLFFGDRADEQEFMDRDTFPTKINFVSNKASKNSGSAIYSTSIEGCRKPNEKRYNNTVFKWKTFYYSGGEKPYIATSAVNITTEHSHWQVSPGIPFNPTVTLLDENFNSVSDTLNVTIIPKKPGSPVWIMGGRSHLFVVKDNKIGLVTLTGKISSKFSVLIQTVNHFPVQLKLPDQSLTKCPLGLYQDNTGIECKCLSRFSDGLSNGVTQCLDYKPYILHGRWGDPSNYGKNFASHVCPYHYCSKICQERKGIDCLYDEKTQCGKNRQWNSILCGKCKPGYSVNLFNEECVENKKCKIGMGILVICATLAVRSLFVALVLYLNVDAYSSYLNAPFYSFQVIPLFYRGNQQLDLFISVVTGVLTWSGTAELNTGFCIAEGMTDLGKMFLNYLFPTYLIFFTVGIGVVSNYRRNSWLNKHTCFRAFAFLSVVAYADFSRITFMLLHYVHVRDRTVLYYAGEVKYFGKEHLSYAVPAIFVLVFVVILFPILVMFPYHFIKLPGIIKLKGVFDAFRYCFNKEHEIFCGFYFVTRCILQAISICIQTSTLQHTLLLIFCILAVVTFATCKPYKSKLMNYYDISLLTDICIIAGLNAATGGVVEENVRKRLRHAADVLAYVPLACIIGHLIYWMVLKSKARKAKKQAKPKESRIPYRVHERELRDNSPFASYGSIGE